MNIYVDEIPDNCNRCPFAQRRSQHLDREDFCIINKLHLGRFDKEDKCPLVTLEGEIRHCSKW